MSQASRVRFQRTNFPPLHQAWAWNLASSCLVGGAFKSERTLLVIILLAMTACTSTTVYSLQPSENNLPTTSDHGEPIYFPRQKKTEGERAVMEALTRGTLVLTDSCIRLERGKSLANYLLIWPPDFDIRFENSAVEIMDSNGEVAAHLGDFVNMGGGEIHLLSQLDQFIQEQVPAQCPGPYWIVGEGFAKATPYPSPSP
jgi:hypothetical protein